MASAAIYARVSSARQKKDQTIASQTAALRAHAAKLHLELPAEWVFEDEGHSGATLVRPGLERLRDLVAEVGVDVVLCYAPDRLARKFAYQVLLIEEFARAGTRTEFIKGPRGDSPEDQLLVQFQGMFAEYEKAQLMERYRRGKTYRARTGSVNVLAGAPFGYRYRRKTPEHGAGYQIVEHEAALVAELFRRYTDDGASIAELARWLTTSGTPTRTGKTRWDRSVVWGMLRNPAYAGTAVFGKTQIIHQPAGLNRRARLQGRTTPRAVKAVDRPRKEWIAIPVPAIISREAFERAAQRLEDNKRFASRNSKVPSLLQGLAACASCGYGYYRTSTRTARKKIYYYRCLGSDDYRYEGGRICSNKPVRADLLDAVVWDHLTGLLADPHLVRAEIDKRLERARTSDPVTRQRTRLELALAKATTAITRMIEAFQEQLLTIDELRGRMPDLRARQSNLRGQLDALDAQLADRDAYLKLADDLEGFLVQLRGNADHADVSERQRVLRLLVKDVLIGPDKITIRHRIPVRKRAGDSDRYHDTNDTEGEMHPSYLLRWGRGHPALGSTLLGRGEPTILDHARLKPLPHQTPTREGAQRPADVVMAESVECRRQIGVEHPQPFGVSAAGRGVDGHDRVMAAPARPKPIALGLEPGLPLGLQCVDRQGLQRPVGDHGNPEPAAAPVALGHIHPLDSTRRPRLGLVLRPAGQIGLVCGRHHHLAVDPGRLAASILLRHPPHAHQRVRAGAEHQLLQIADLGKVPCPRRREDPLPQPPYVLLDLAPIHGVPVQRLVLGSVHHDTAVGDLGRIPHSHGVPLVT
jgi:site-specific DNA recombinase